MRRRKEESWDKREGKKEVGKKGRGKEEEQDEMNFEHTNKK